VSRSNQGAHDSCNLCNKNSLLVRSHIIPRAFFDLGPNPGTKLLSNIPGQFPKRAPAGVYDFIVCDGCERSFNEYDDYGAKVLIQELDSYERIVERGKFAGLRATGIDYRLLKLFSISLLWRASVARHPFYSRVRLGQFERPAREMLMTGDPGGTDEFATWWSFFDLKWSPRLLTPSHRNSRLKLRPPRMM